MGNMIRNLAVAVLAASVALPAAASASATTDAVRRPLCGEFRLSGDHVCLMAVRGQVRVNLHVQKQHGHDAAFAAGYMGTGGHLWLERRHGGRTQTLGRKTARGDGMVSMGQDSAVYDGLGYKARACADAKGGRLRACTSWH
ncbi:hypothetical protein GT030_19910 [Streptomyces sp. SID1328]|uniref:hypothetical protein n=1 Tax=Streptomyces sp. SID1328 TaxID=2690250 RepID=UPI00136E17BF|nr:hypothetical protein [Streptomyces sp. SID1328]MYV41074.1 hypothetical protein [Streptomyces sp. SID1328]